MILKERSRSLGWFIPLRLASFIILFTVVVFYMGYPSFLRSQFILYATLTLCFTLLLTLNKKLKFSGVTFTFISLQFLFEIIIESGIIYATGNVNSPFSALFILTIVSAALVYGLMGTLLVASGVSFAYAFIIWLGLFTNIDSNVSVSAIGTIFIGHENAFYSIFLHILIFYLVAFISGYLTERLKLKDKQLEVTSEALKRARLETDDILLHLNSGLLTIDQTGTIIFFNRAAEEILGYKNSDVKGLHCSEVFAERMPMLSEYLLEGLYKKINYPRKEISIKSIDGRIIPLGLSTSVLKERDGNPRGVITIFSDLTEAKNLESKIRAADRLAAVGELSASIAHEIRNPLASISGSVEVLMRELHLSGENERLMTLIVKESHRLSKILSEFLCYAKIDKPVYNKVELCHVISEVIQMLYHHDSFHDGIKIKFETDHSFVYIIGDEDLFKQLLINLLVNASEAIGGNNGEIILRVVKNKNSNMVELFVQDDGPGIPEYVIRKIYQPFYSTKKAGTGLGLSIVHRICQALNLNISVVSQTGEGTTFMLEIPEFITQTGKTAPVYNNSEHITA